MTCLGIVMAYVSMYFISRLEKHTVAGLAGIAGVLLGGVVGQFLVEHTPASSDTIWWYPIGLLLGLLFWGVVRFIIAAAAASGKDLANLGVLAHIFRR